MRLEALGGTLLLLGVLGLGLLALTPQVSRHDLAVDQSITAWRSPWATTALTAVTTGAQQVVGLGVLTLGLVVLWLRRRRWEAARLLVMAASAWTLALVLKPLFDRPRPPARLWAMRPDPTGSFPSGHETTASVIVVIAAVSLAGLPYLRALATALAVAFAAAVGVSRVYLGDHYPTDVLGGFLTVAAAALLASAVLDSTRVRALGARLQPPASTTAVPAPPARLAVVQGLAPTQEQTPTPFFVNPGHRSGPLQARHTSRQALLRR